MEFSYDIQGGYKLFEKIEDELNLELELDQEIVVTEKEIDGEQAEASEIDGKETRFGALQAARRVDARPDPRDERVRPRHQVLLHRHPRSLHRGGAGQRGRERALPAVPPAPAAPGLPPRTGRLRHPRSRGLRRRGALGSVAHDAGRPKQAQERQS